MYTNITPGPLLQAAEQAQKLREARKDQADVDGNVNDMERAQDFLKAGNVKVLSLAPPRPFSSPQPLYGVRQGALVAHSLTSPMHGLLYSNSLFWSDWPVMMARLGR